MNKAQVEGSISIGYIMDEAAKFASFYFNEGDPTLPLKEKRNEVYLDDIVDDDMFEIFKPPGKEIGAEGKRYLADNEYIYCGSSICPNELSRGSTIHKVSSC